MKYMNQLTMELMDTYEFNTDETLMDIEYLPIILNEDSNKYKQFKLLLQSSIINNYTTIVKIEKVENLNVVEEYNKIKSKLLQINKLNIIEKQLMHGTQECNVDSIKNYGFQKKYNTRTVYGRGTYFSNSFVNSILYSYSYGCKYICVIISKVLIINNTGIIDVNSDTKYYLVKEDNLCYPEYIIYIKLDEIIERYLRLPSIDLRKLTAYLKTLNGY